MATRTLGPGKLTITDTESGRDFSAEVTKVQLVASNPSQRLSGVRPISIVSLE